MKSKIIRPLIMSILLIYSEQSFSQNSTEDDKNILKQLEYNWLMAEFRLDTASVSSMMDDKFMSIGLNGLSSKQEELAGIFETMTQRKKDNHVVDSLYLDDFKTLFFGNTAIVTFFSVTKGTIQGVPFQNRRTRMYDVWIKTKSEWKAVSSQVTPIK